MKKQKNQTTFREDTGKLLQDIGKLVFGSIFLGGVLRGEVPQNILLISGFVGATIFCLVGLILAVKKKDRNIQE
ncbi:MAG: hypothetical protein LBU66_05060 [Treponema sp.]|jgi:uncharacterized membrane protein YraQ (UPF0718 family)|nr:hypothetical protein [Treponema sp.]